MGDSNPFSGISQLAGEVGNAIGGDIGSAIKDPLKNPTGLLGLNSVGSSLYGVMNLKKTLLDDPKFEAEKAAGQARKIADDARLAQEEEDRKNTLTKKRDEDRLKQRSLALEDQGRAGTILTSPLGNTLGTTGAQTKTILGS